MALRRALPVLLALLACAAGAAPASAAVPLRGVQLHSLWYSASVTDMERELDLARDANANAVRVDVSWSSLETAGRGRLSEGYVDRLDRFMAGAADRGMRVVASLYTTPCWASSAPESAKLGCTGAWWERGVTSHPPNDPAEFGRVARWMTARYGTRLAALEIWNEPNNPLFLVAPDPAAAYAQLVRAAYPAAKEGDPRVPVLAGSMSFADRDFLERLYDHGIKGFNDGIAVHPYNEWRAPGDMWQERWRKYTLVPGTRAVHDVTVARGDDKGIWLTEFGWTDCTVSATADPWCIRGEDQAAYVESSFPLLAAEPYVRAALVYNLRDKGTDRSYTEDNFGLVRRDFSPKPAYAALQRALALEARAEASGAGAAGGGGTGGTPRVAAGAIGDAWRMSGGRALRATIHQLGRTVWLVGQGPLARTGTVKVATARRRPVRLRLRTDARGRFSRKLGPARRLAGRRVELRIGRAVARALVRRGR